MNFVIIANRFSDVESRILSFNIRRIKSITDNFHIVYCVNSIDCSINGFRDEGIKFVQITVSPKRSSCAAINRATGWKCFLEIYKGDVGPLITFLDGDMVISRRYLKYLNKQVVSEIRRPSIVCCDRIDFRYRESLDEIVSKRIIGPKTYRNGSFRSIYGSFAICNINPNLIIDVHDHEEQWFLTMCKAVYGQNLDCIKVGCIGIFHFDRWYGWRRFLRVIGGSRGVGFWQGLFSFKYSKYGFTAVKEQLAILLLPIFFISIAIADYRFLIFFILFPKILKRLIWLSIGLIKLPFFPMARTVERKVL